MPRATEHEIDPRAMKTRALPPWLRVVVPHERLAAADPAETPTRPTVRAAISNPLLAFRSRRLAHMIALTVETDTAASGSGGRDPTRAGAGEQPLVRSMPVAVRGISNAVLWGGRVEVGRGDLDGSIQ